MLQNVFQQNFKLILERTESIQVKDTELPDLRAKMTDIEMIIEPIGKKWEDLKLELLFDEQTILLELHELEFSGISQIKDPQSGAQEKIEFTAPISTCQIVMTMQEEYAEWGSLYPRVNIDDVRFTIDENLIVVSAFGDLPMYKSHQFEQSVKKWFTNQLTKRQQDFKEKLQEVEKNLWSYIPFSKKFLGTQIALNSSLSEPLKAQGDYIVASFQNEFTTKLDYSDFEERLQPVNPTFSNTNDFKKDVQFTFDENLINNQLFGLFNANKVFSLTEILIDFLPKNMQMFGNTLQNFFTTMWFAAAFPEITKEHGTSKRVDLRCGFSKTFLQGKLEDNHVSQIWFKDGNTFEYSFHFGCGIFVDNSQNSNGFQDLFKAIIANQGKVKKKEEAGDWVNFRSFFISFHGKNTFDFTHTQLGNIKTDVIMQGKILDFDVKIKELKVFKGANSDKEDYEEESEYKKRFNKMIESLKNTNFSEITKRLPFIQGIPLSPYPKFEKCLGITPYNGEIEILDRFVRIGFDMKVLPADEECLFTVFEADEEKYFRWSNDSKMNWQFPSWSDIAKSAKFVQKGIETKAKSLAKDAKKKIEEFTTKKK